MYINGAAIIRNRSKVGAKPQSSPGGKDLGRSDPEALDELEEVEGKLYQQDTGISIYVSSGRFDIQYCVKRLSEMMTKPRKLGNPRLARLARYLVGTGKLVLRFDHQEYGDTGNCRRLRLGWAGIPWRTSCGLVGCIRSSASIEFRRSRAPRNRGRLGTRNLHKAHVRGDGKNHQHRRRNGLDGCDRDVFPNGRWKDQLWIQDATRDKVVRVGKVRGIDNEADMGTKDLDGPTHQRFFAETAAQANPVQTAPGP